MYECYCCNFSTDRLENLKVHNKSAKHNKNIQCGGDTNCRFRCNGCGKYYSSLQNLQTHQNQYCNVLVNKKKLKNTKNDNINNKNLSNTSNVLPNLHQNVLNIVENSNGSVPLNVLETVIEMCKTSMNQTAQLINTINTQALTNKKSVNMLSYAMKYFKDAPPIELLEGEKLNNLITYDGNEEIHRAIISSFNLKKLHMFIGDMIINVYKKDNPKDRSFWLTDRSRLSFIIKTIVDNETKSLWVADKSGKKLTTYVITPILDQIRKILLNYIKCNDSDESDSFEYENYSSDNDYESDQSSYKIKIKSGKTLINKSNRKLSRNKKLIESDYDSDSGSDYYSDSYKSPDIKFTENKAITEILILISNKELHKSILRYIAPVFGYDISEINFSKI